MIGHQKPEPGYFKRLKAKRRAARRETVAIVRPAVFGRLGGWCECCQRRRAESMHEMKARSIGGEISEANSVAVCGSGTTGCHGHLQAHRIVREVVGDRMLFVATRESARRWMRGEI